MKNPHVGTIICSDERTAYLVATALTRHSRMGFTLGGRPLGDFKVSVETYKESYKDDHVIMVEQA